MAKKFVCLEGVHHQNRFYSTYTEGEDPRLSAAGGEVWYRILGYADTSEEALSILGISHKPLDRLLDITNNLLKTPSSDK